jgi:hypothetical protein
MGDVESPHSVGRSFSSLLRPLLQRYRCNGDCPNTVAVFDGFVSRFLVSLSASSEVEPLFELQCNPEVERGLCRA